MSPTTHESFGIHTTATEVARAFADEVRGKIFVVTGVSPNSLGSALALSIASQAPGLLILASRTRAKLDVVVRGVRERFPSANVKVVLLDLADPGSVRAAAAEVGRLVGEGRGGGGGAIDALFNNAGINISQRRLARGYGAEVGGVELQFATNHLGPFLLTNLLMPLLKKGSRVVMTSSEGHRLSPVRFSDYNQEPGKKLEKDDEPRRGLALLRDDGRYNQWVAYAQSKTANVLMAVGLNARIGARGVESFAVMPGAIMTDLVRDISEDGIKVVNSTIKEWKDLDQGAATMLVAAFDRKLSPEAGVYLDDCQIRRPSKWANDPLKAERLWKLSEDLVGEKFKYGNESKL